MKSSNLWHWWFVASVLLLGSCRHVHSKRWIEDEVTAVEATRSFSEGTEDSLVRVDWVKLEEDSELVVSTWRGAPGQEDVDFKTRVEERVTSYNLFHIVVKAVVLPFYLVFFLPFTGGEDHDLDGEIGVIDKLTDFIAWMNPLQAPPLKRGRKRNRTVDEGRRTEAIYSAHPVPFATVRVEFKSEDEQLPLVLITGADGTAQLNLSKQLEKWKRRPIVRASWDSPEGTVTVWRSVYL